MSTKRTYINIINDFWTLKTQKRLSMPASLLYLYLLNLINRNRWEAVFISDHELAAGAGVSRRHLPEYKKEIEAAGLLIIEANGVGRTAGTVYRLTSEEMAPEGANTKDEMVHKGANSKNVMEPKGTVNGAKRSRLSSSTPYNITYKTFKTNTSTTTSPTYYEDDLAVGNIGDVEASPKEKDFFEVENATIPTAVNNAASQPELKKVPAAAVNNAASQLELKKERAAAQGDEILKSFFADSNLSLLFDLAGRCRLAPQEYRQTAERIIAEWVQQGRTHDDCGGHFDIGEGIRHLRLTIPKKAAAEARAAEQPVSRDAKRRQLMAAAVQNLNKAIFKEAAPPGQEYYNPLC